jgi:cytochrome b6-f complex iron-sulfur subunit
MSEPSQPPDAGKPAEETKTPETAITTEAAKPPDTAVTAAAKPAAPPKPTPPPKPAAPPAGKERRGFLVAFASAFAIAWIAFTGTMTAWLLGSIRFLFPNVLSEPPSKFKAGFPSQFEEGKVTDVFKDRNAWVIKYQGKIYALSTTCTHLGCTPNWLESAGKFKCPCHGSGFYISGVNFEGPAPRPLERWGIGLSDDGQIVVDKSKKFQKEMGQWDSPDSYLKV